MHLESCGGAFHGSSVWGGVPSAGLELSHTTISRVYVNLMRLYLLLLFSVSYRKCSLGSNVPLDDTSDDTGTRAFGKLLFLGAVDAGVLRHMAKR